MAKYTIRYNIIMSHEIEVDADSIAEAKEKTRFDYFPKSDIIQDFAEHFPQGLEMADVEVDSVFNEDGDYAF